MGAVVTIICASLNLLVPELIRSFVQFMNTKSLTKAELSSADIFLYKFILIQTLRLFFSQHSKRLFHQLAIQIQSTLARKLVSKSLKLARQCKDKIPQSEIIHLQNIDLKLIFSLFRNLHLVFEVPFTIIVAIVMIFTYSNFYGFIAVYWFVIAFLLQRQLDSRMRHCNKTKLSLIQTRSKLNYQLLDRMKQAKIIGYENIIVEKNNDLFIEQNHDHQMYYRYSTMYDITLLLLPILFVVTIALYDINEETPITVQQVYSLLALLGICYLPMKNTRVIAINLHDGLHSMKKFQSYFGLQEEKQSQLIDKTHEVGDIMIKNGTVAGYSQSNCMFVIKCTFHVEINKGERLNVICRKSHGSSSFLEMLVGELKRINGTVFINGKIAYKPQHLFFLKQSIEQNIRFYNKQINSQQVRNICKQLGLDNEFKLFVDGLDTIIDDTKKFTTSTLQKIALARTLISDADIYILDSPYTKIDSHTAIIVQDILRQKQLNGKTVVIALNFLQFIQPQDHIIILNEGVTDEYGTFEKLTRNSHSKISKFFKSKGDQSAFSQTKSQQIVDRFRNKAKMRAREISAKQSSINAKTSSVMKLLTPTPLNPLTLMDKLKGQQSTTDTNFTKYISKFFLSINFFQLIYILIIILSAQLLHIFIHFFIGHLSDDHGDQGYLKYRNMLILEVILTICLSGIIYLEGQVSSYIAIIIGNRLYEESLGELTKKRITWFDNQYTVKIADRFNHDYEQIFIAVHALLGIYKNIIIFIATIQFITTNRHNILLIMTLLAVLYFLVFRVIRMVQKKVVKNYYDYKYSFVRVLEQSVSGSCMYRVYGVKDQIMRRAEEKYERLASYKLAQSYTTYAIEILTDVISIILLGSAIFYGIEMKENNVQARHIAVIATSITLLVNLSQVLKTIIKESLNFGTFFAINIVPFLEILHLDTDYKKLKGKNKNEKQQKITFSKLALSSYGISFNNIVLQQPSYVGMESRPLSFSIKQGQRVLIYETDDKARDLLLYSFTKNLPMLTEPQFFTNKADAIIIGNQDIRQISPQKLRKLIGVIKPRNFYFSGSIKENISFQERIDEKEAIEYIISLGLNLDLSDFVNEGLETKLNFEANQLNSSITKKIALLRILVHKPKIIIIKDTTSFIQSISIIEMIETNYPFKPTIIKINNSIESSFDIDRIIHMEHLVIKEDGLRKDLVENRNSEVGEMMKDVNLEGYLYTQRTECLSARTKKNSIFADLIPFSGKKFIKQGQTTSQKQKKEN